MKIFYYIIVFFTLFEHAILPINDLVLVGELKYSLGIGRLPIGIADCLKDCLSIKFKRVPGAFDLSEISKNLRQIFSKDCNEISKVCIFFDILWVPNRGTNINLIPSSIIKFAYSMFESTAIPPEWVKILNKKFDGVIVPDPCLIDIYKKSGVNIPIFFLPCGLYLEKLLNLPQKKKSSVFTFGISAAFWQHKNHYLLLEAFAKEFGNDPKVRLKIHGRPGLQSIILKLQNRIKELKLRNVKLSKKELNEKEYVKFLRSLDCYVLLSKGEGFSVTPREALALGVPCIISNSLAHQSICNSGLAYQVKAKIKEPAFYAHLGNSYGFNFNCEVSDVQEALRKMYNNYDFYKEKISKRHIWLKQFFYSSLKPKYKALVKPKQIILGKVNEIGDNVLMTNSSDLYFKYKKILDLQE